MPEALITSRDDKGRHAVGLFEAVYNKSRLDSERAHRLNENRGGEFTDGLQELIERCSTTNRHIDEEVASSFGYFSGYRKPVEIIAQINILRSHWPNLNPDLALRYAREKYPTLQLSGWVEGPFAIIRPGFFSDKYEEELLEVLKAIAKDRQGGFVNYRDGQLGPQYLRQSERTLYGLRLLMEQQPSSDILVVPAQFGIRHRGRSVRRAREVFVNDEFGPGAKDVGTMLLTNPVRLQHYDDLWIDCGDEYSPGAGGQFSSAPCFGCGGGGVKFDADGVGDASGRYGSPSASLSQ